jgi:gas vesicle protein
LNLEIWGYIFGGATIFGLIVGIFAVYNGRMIRREIGKLIKEESTATRELIKKESTATRELIKEESKATRELIKEESIAIREILHRIATLFERLLPQNKK